MWLWTRLAGAACLDDGADAIVEHARALEAAYEALDEDGFSQHYEALGQAAACVRSELGLDALLAWHRARALGEFFEREYAASAKSWAAVKVLDPSWSPPGDWLVPGTPLHKAWTEAPMGASRITLERSPEGGWRVDGQPTNAVPAERGFILQGFDASGAVVHTDYHYSVAEVPVVDFEALDPTARERRRRRMHTIGSIATVALAAGAVGTLSVAAFDELAVKGDRLALDKVQGRAQRANLLYGVGAGLGSGAVAVSGVTWLVNW